MSDAKQPTSRFQQLLEERRARERAEKEAAQVDADLIPEDPYNKSDADKALDDAVNRIDFASAYKRYIGKEIKAERRGRTEGHQISCPVPGHRDSNPSAWYNSETKLWFCAPCNLGGDIMDIAAIGKGYAWPNTYKTDGSFHRLRVEMASDFGFTVVKHPGGVAELIEPEPEPVPEPDKSDQNGISQTNPDNLDTAAAPSDASSRDRTASSDADVIELYEADENILIPPFNWNRIIVPGTYLHSYMKQVKVDDVPLEFHLFHALIGLGMALGRDVKLYDSIPVYGNMFVCTLGRTGSGKSKAKYHLDRLLAKALPYDTANPLSTGVKLMPEAGSAESLIHNFLSPIIDPSDPKKILGSAPVRGLISYNELSGLIGRANRAGSVIKPTLMKFYDMETKVAVSSLTHGIKEALEPFACAITSTQPRALRDLLGATDDASGFLNRWVYVLGTPKKRIAIGGAEVDMTPVVAPLQEIHGWASGFRRDEMVIWSDEAADRFTDFFHSVIEPEKERSNSDIMVRIDLLLKKLILLFTANQKLKKVPLECVDAALELYDYLIAGFTVPADEVRKTAISELQDAILGLALKQYKMDGKGVTLRQISKSLWRRGYSAKQVADTVDALVKLGLLDVTTSKIGNAGRPAVRYVYVA